MYICVVTEKIEKKIILLITDNLFDKIKIFLLLHILFYYSSQGFFKYNWYFNRCW